MKPCGFVALQRYQLILFVKFSICSAKSEATWSGLMYLMLWNRNSEPRGSEMLSLLQSTCRLIIICGSVTTSVNTLFINDLQVRLLPKPKECVFLSREKKNTLIFSLLEEPKVPVTKRKEWRRVRRRPIRLRHHFVSEDGDRTSG